MMKKFFLSTLLLLLGFLNFTYSQDYLGFANSAFAGVNGIDVNPAFIVNNPRKWDVTIAGINVAAANSYLGLNTKGRKHLLSLNPDPFDQKNYITYNSNGKPVSVFFATNVSLPSFMFTRKSHQDAFAFTARTRGYINVDGVPSTVAHAIINGKNDSAIFNQDLSAVRVSAQAMIWSEYGITYGKTIAQTSNERLNVAGQLKFLQGIYAMYLFINNVNYKFYKEDSVLVVSSLVHYGVSPNLEFNPSSIKFGFGAKPALGLDLGATYEFYPLTNVRTRMSSESKTTPFQNEYKYKIGLSIQDLGWLKYMKPLNARDFTAEYNNLDFNSLQTGGSTPLADANDSLAKKFTMVPNDNKFRMNLPTVVSLQSDYYAGKNIYVNSTLNYAFQFSNNEDKIHEVTTFSITPRWDWKYLGTYFPFSYNKYSHVRAGASLRLGPLIFGTADLLPLISNRDIKGVDFHFLLKVPHLSFKKKNKMPTRSKSKFSVNKEKEKHKTLKPEKRKKKERPTPEVKQEKKVRKHIFPKINWFKKKRKHSANPEKRGTVIYFKL
jgi:hypothetical protein